MVYRWSSDIVWLSSDGSVRDVTQGVEATPFPEPVYIDESTPRGRIRGVKVDPAAVAFTQMQPGADSERIYILPLGRTEHARKVVDTYAIATGEYMGSCQLPHAVSSITVLEDGSLATLEVDLVPTVRIWRMQ